MKDVLITIKGSNSNDKEIMELTTVGSLSVKNGKHYISYKESEDMGVNEIKTVLKVDDENSISLTRSGAVRSNLIIEKGKRHNCYYDTGYGDIMVGIFGESIKSTMSDKGGKLFMKYTIDVNSELLGENEVEIVVKEKNS